MRTQISSGSSGLKTTCRRLFVSSSRGRSGNDGHSADNPLASLADAVARVNGGGADRLLLRRGDVFTHPIGRWTCSGRSPSARSVIAAYGPGDRRPVVRCRGTALELTAGEGGELHDVLVKGVHFVAAGRDPDEPGFDRRRPLRRAAGICVHGPGVRRVTIEDCRVEQFDDDVAIEGGAGDVRLWRCALLDVIAAAGGAAHQLAAYGCEGSIRIDSCVFDQNIPTAGASHHHVFAPHGNAQVIVSGCVVSRSPGTALLLDAQRNVVAKSILFGNRLHLAAGGAEAVITRNVILSGQDRPAPDEESSPTSSSVKAGVPSGHGIYATADDLRIEHNVIAHRRRARAAAIVLAARDRSACDRGGRAEICGNVIYRCGGGIGVAAAAPYRSIKVFRNDLQRLSAGQLAVTVRDAPPELIFRNNRYGMFDQADDAAIRFRLDGERLAFEEWARRTGDTSAVVRIGGNGHATRLPRRFVADARAQSGNGWRAHLSPPELVARFFRAFDLPRRPEPQP